MYSIHVISKNVEKRFHSYVNQRNDILDKIERLRIEPRRANGAHPLHGKLVGKWGCWLGYNIRLMYVIDDSRRIITILAVGTHKIY